ncbi:SUN domain-containing protein 2-like [Camellia sinensis]|uniref:SUN domain-containing protein 2-like n=1 Tax=Camellia sinensis TaxID=4442 RepID=UPI00103615DA|nr:SUN domain-containing protein 2-like [Camellia sinensis]
MALLYWLCEHTLIIHPEVSETCPRVIKWNLIKLHKRMKVISLHQLTRRQVTSAQLNEENDEELDDTEEKEKEDAENTEDEKQEDAEEQEQEQQKQDAENTEQEEDSEEEDEQIHQQTLEKLQTENNNLQLDSTVKTIYINKLEEDNRLLTAQIQQLKDENSRLHNQLVEKEVHEITQEVCGVKHSGTDTKNECHTINNENSQVLQKEVHENSEVVDKELHQKEVHEITQQPFATKHCETNTNVKDCQNSQLQNQLVEEEVHDLTQQCLYMFGVRYDNCVFINDIKNLTIDAYAEILEKEPQAQNSGDGAEHNGKSFILSSLYWISKQFE